MGSPSRIIQRALIACLLLAGCVSDGSDGSGFATPESAEASATAAASRSGGDATPAPDAAPPELAGRWRRSLQGEPIVLTLDGTGYHIQRGAAGGSGRISVDGDQIEFSGSNLCSGSGTYTWSFENERLRFTEIVADPCDGRTIVLLRATFGRVEE